VPSRPTETNPQGLFQGSFKYSPLQRVRELYISFVKGLFAASPPGHYHWSPDNEQTEIYISDENPIKADVAGPRPAISFTRGPVQFYTLGFDDMLTFNLKNEQKQKSVLVPGTMTINCCSRVDIEGDNIAWVVAEHLWLLRDLLMKSGFFEVGRQPVIGAPSPAGSIVSNDGGDEWYVTSITCPFQFYRTSQFTPLGQNIVQEIQASLRTRPNAALSKGWPSAAGRPEVPVQIETSFPPPFSPASDAHGGTPDPLGPAPSLPLVPHPLNPAQLVTVRPARPYQAGLRPPSIHGRSIPLSTSSVEQSETQEEVLSTFKV
jgi:hypothetical protein